MLNKIKYTLLSMFTVFKHLFKRPVTLEYPEKKCSVNGIFRGKLTVEGCIKCGNFIKIPVPCEEACPVGAISKGDDGKEHIDYEKCIFCGNCTYYCPVKAIRTSKDYELATNNEEMLELTYEIKEGK